jgi:NAD(P)-dependent dehydrogenase (short-subunit alcohol dehydrogenase family)
MSMSELSGKRAVITGASRGIGREIALTLAAAGAEVILVSRTIETLELVAGEVRAAGGVAASQVCDLSSRDAVIELTTQVDDVDVLVNNAAPEEHYLPITEPDDTHWERTFAVNFTAPLLLTREFGRKMASAGAGSIINITSIVARDPAPLMGAYVCSKAALESLTRLTALELGGYGVRANAIAPGVVATDLTAALLADGPSWQALKAAIPLGRAGEVSDVAGLALFLAGPRSSFLSGQVIALDGGATAGQHALLAAMDAELAN